MANRLGNIGALFKDSRTRTIILITLFVLIIAIFVGIFSMRGKKGVEASAGISSAPGGIQSIPFSAPNKAYANLQQQQNVELAKQAEQTGGSALPTIINSEKVPANINPDATTGVGFTALSREQSDAGTFEAKAFNNKATAPVCVPPAESSANAQNRNPIYDQNGRLIGYLGKDGKVHDALGNIIGAMGSDGLVRDLSGRVIGQQAKTLAGTPVYDDKGDLIGAVGEDGKVYDANGRIVGTVGSDGKVRDITGKILGSPGVPVYDKNGKLLGFSGLDGKLRDASGAMIGTVGPDGTARDLSGNVIGKTGAISPGSPVYDSNGKIIGYVGPDGKARDLEGRVLGKMGVDGLLKDVNGQVIGGINPPLPVSANASSQTQVKPSNASKENNHEKDLPVQQATDLSAVADKISNDQKLSQLLSQKQQAMNSQANQLLAAWVSPSQQYVAGQADTGAKSDDNAQNGKELNVTIGDKNANQKATGPVFIKAGTVYYAVINTSINSDEPGPVMATVINGDYKGGKLLGSVVNQGQAVLLSFNILTLPQFSKSIPINAVAIDQNTARTALSTETDNHYLLRFGSLFAASFFQGYGQAVSSAGTTTSVGPFGNTTTQHAQLNGRQEFFAALGNVGSQFGTQMNQIYSTPPTVYVAAGSSVGILFMSDVMLPTS